MEVLGKRDELTTDNAAEIRPCGVFKFKFSGGEKSGAAFGVELLGKHWFNILRILFQAVLTVTHSPSLLRTSGKDKLFRSPIRAPTPVPEVPLAVAGRAAPAAALAPARARCGASRNPFQGGPPL